MSTIDKKDLIAIRLGTEEDKSFIFSTWLKGLYYGDSWFSNIPKDVFMQHHHPVIERLLVDPAVIVTVACLKDDPEVILGYAVQTLDGSTVHWCFVKKSWRNIGLAKNLISAKVTAATHLTKAGLSILRKHPGIVFNPYKI